MRLSDQEIISGFRKGNAAIIRDYFYGYCLVGYYVFDKRYQLSSKENLDFLSLAHQYAIYLMEHDWKPLEDHSPNVSLKTWIINGFRYVVLDALKWYRKEYGTITFADYLQSFDMTDNLRLQFNRMIEDICDHAPLSRSDRTVIDMLLLRGFKGNEIAAQLGMTPSAVSQKFKKLKEQYIIPYFKQNFNMDWDTPDVIDDRAWAYGEAMFIPEEKASVCYSIRDVEKERRTPMPAPAKPFTPYVVTQLRPNEIFVFGSNLKGIHGGGAAYLAYRKFGAVMGQGVGLQGQSYAIPTMQGGVETILPYVNDFLLFAEDHPDNTFLVTRIGCGMAGFDDSEIAPLFAAAHSKSNILLPEGW